MPLSIGVDKRGEELDLERKVRKLAAYPNVYVCAIFDCCRSQYPANLLKDEEYKEEVIFLFL